MVTSATQGWGGGRGWGSTPAVAPKHRAFERVSASQISTFRDCNRKWFFRYILGHPVKPNRFAQLGTYIHKVLEQYLKTGWLQQGPALALEIRADGEVYSWSHDDIAEIVLPGLIYLPSKVVYTERHFNITLPEGLPPLTGYKDYGFADIDSTVVVGDHKTTSNIKKYALSQVELQTDVQCIIYALEDLLKGAPSVRCQWGYFQTAKSKPKAIQVCATYTEDTIAPLWDGVLSDIRNMKSLELCDTKDVAFDSASCYKYGGCPFRGNVCQLSTTESVRSFYMANALMDRMRASQAAAAAQAQATTPAQAPVGQAPAPTAPPAQTPAPAQAPAQAPAPASAAPATSLNPPEASSALARLQMAKAAQGAAPAQAPAPAAAAAPAPAQAPAQAPAPAQMVLAGTGAVVPAQAVAPAQAPVQATTKYIHLYIDCAPNDGYTEFADLAAPVLAELEQEFGKHYRLIEGLYGGNAALFAKAMGMALDCDPTPISVVISTASPTARDALEALEARAVRITRGF
jgi:hypothetical protein